MPSQQDVAALAKVSFMTVSRVINNHPNVNKETRARVLKAIEKLGYYPNASARALNAQKSKNIGLIFPRKEYAFSLPFYIELSVEIEDQLSMCGYHMLVGMTNDGDKDRDLSRLIKERKVDGLILVAPPSDGNDERQLTQEGLPFIKLLSRDISGGNPFVDTDNVAGMRLIMNHLFSCGHRRIGFVCGNLDEINAQDRYNTYLNELARMDIPFDKRMVYRGDWSLRSGYDAFLTLLDRQLDLTAIAFSNDNMALGAIRAAYNRNVSIPEDISISGYDDTKYAEYSVPSLTTIRQPLTELAKTAADLMIRRVEGKENIEGIILGSELIVRSSCRQIEPARS